jgi:hypothetical protein
MRGIRGMGREEEGLGRGMIGIRGMGREEDECTKIRRDMKD